MRKHLRPPGDGRQHRRQTTEKLQALLRKEMPRFARRRAESQLRRQYAAARQDPRQFHPGRPQETRRALKLGEKLPFQSRSKDMEKTFVSKSIRGNETGDGVSGMHSYEFIENVSLLILYHVSWFY